MKRVGVYFVQAEHETPHWHVLTFLQALRPFLSDLVIVCQGTLSEQGKEKLSRFAPKIIESKNAQNYFSAYQEGVAALGWQRLAQYDAAVFCSDALMGPVHAFDAMFTEMQTRSCDVWGIVKRYPATAQTEAQNTETDSGCLESSFFVCKQSALQNRAFQNIWSDTAPIFAKSASAEEQEKTFAEQIDAAECTVEAYVDTDDLRGITDRPFAYAAAELLRNRQCPVFDCRVFSQEYDVQLAHSLGASALDLFRYLQTETDFPLNALWENLLCYSHQSDLSQNLHWNYILSAENAMQPDFKTQKTALLIHVYYTDMLQQVLPKINCMPKTADVYITTDSALKKADIEAWLAQHKSGRKTEVRVISNRGRDVSSLLVGMAELLPQYDIACFIHDKKSAGMKPGSVGADYARHCLDNLLGSTALVQNILALFSKESRLGMLAPPVPNHGKDCSGLYPTLGREWSQNYAMAAALAEELHFNVPMSPDKPPIAPFGTCFWFRTAALMPLLKKQWQYTDFPCEPNGLDGTILHALERLYPFAVQQAGYYPATVMSDQFARIYNTNLNYYLSGFNKIAYSHGLITDYQTMRNTMQKHLYLPFDKMKQTHQEGLRQWKFRLRRLLPTACFDRILAWKRKLFDRAGTQYDDTDKK
ncbi:MAG: rhamnan synthesis F family protein [Ruthenibacterium sp.]